RVVLDALVPDQIEIALAAASQLEQESRQLERQWALRVERARYEAERARRQYDAVEPENRLVARSLERAWEEKLRVVEAVEQQHARWRAQEPLLIGPAERAGLQALGENLPRIWNAATTSAADRKRILRFVIRKVVLDQKRTRGQVWLKIVWQTGATSVHHVQRRVHNLDMIVGGDAAALPARKDIGLVRQLPQFRTVDLSKQFGPAGAEPTH